MSQDQDLCSYVSSELGTRANADNAVAMQRYLKTDMPMFGVKKPDLRAVAKAYKKDFAPADEAAFARNVGALWALPHREEKYAAIDYARKNKAFITLAALPLFEQMVREGAWWDLVDDIAAHLVGQLVRDERERMRPILQAWVDDDDLWVRRAAILAQLKHKDETDEEMLFDFCLRRAHEKVFWIRKAIGWVLRDYCRTNPKAVRDFVAAHKGELSGLSVREAKKGIERAGLSLD
jgi:3-methyladenine DNA glycosylase AlkD